MVSSIRPSTFFTFESFIMITKRENEDKINELDEALESLEFYEASQPEPEVQE
jgi:hypothetical protein